MCNSVLRLQIVLCCFLLTWSLPRKSHDMQYGPGGPDGRGMRYREELPRDPWQNSMAELRQYSQPMPPLVPNDEVVSMLKAKPKQQPDLVIHVPNVDAKVNTTATGRRAFRIAAEDAKLLTQKGLARRMNNMQAAPAMRRSMGEAAEAAGAAPPDFGDPEERAQDYGKGDYGTDDYGAYEDDEENEDDPEGGQWGVVEPANCPRDLYLDQLRMDFGTMPPKKYDWEQIGRHFVNYGRFTADMSDDLMRGLDFRFKQMKG